MVGMAIPDVPAHMTTDRPTVVVVVEPMEIVAVMAAQEASPVAIVSR